MASIAKYKKVVVEGPAGYIQHAVMPEQSDHGVTTLATLADGFTYISIPDGITMPAQPAEIEYTQVTLTDEQKEEIKATSDKVQLINQEMVRRIREKYSLDDEQYFARIGVGVALGVYTFQPGEQDALLAFGNFVESIRQWGREERAKLGL